MEPLYVAIRSENGDHVELRLVEVVGFPEHTSHYGGYDVRCQLSIKSAGYAALGELWTSGEVQTLALQLKKALMPSAGPWSGRVVKEIFD